MTKPHFFPASLIFSFFLAYAPVLAEEVFVRPLGWANESEIGIVANGGNTRTGSYNFKSEVVYAWPKDTLKLNLGFQAATSSGVLIARKWQGSLYYDHFLSETVGGFTALGVEGDTFAGRRHRIFLDLGAKSRMITQKKIQLKNESGYRFAFERFTIGQSPDFRRSHFLRTQFELDVEITPTFGAGFDLEFFPSLTDSEDYEITATPAATAIISSVFSLKISYAVRYDNKPSKSGNNKVDYVFTNSLVAKF